MKKTIIALLLALACLTLVYPVLAETAEPEGESYSSLLALLPDLQTVTDEELETLRAAIVSEQKSRIVTTISLDQNSIQIKKGTNAKLTATVMDIPEGVTADKVTWSTADKSIATVQAGSVRALAGGTTTITASTILSNGTEITADCEVTVYTPVSSIKIASPSSAAKSTSGGKSSSAAKVVIGGKFDIAELTTVSPEDATEKGVRYTIDNNELAEISEDGIFTAKAKGNVVITATSVEDLSKPKTATLKVSILQPVETINLDEPRFNVGNGRTHKLTYNVTPENADDQSVTWVSDNPEIATITKAGVVTGKGTGTCKITCTANDGSGATATAEVTVITAVKKIALSDKTLSFVAGDSDSVSATVTPENATDTTVTWSSSDESVATVDANGTIKAKSSGKCTVTATAADGSGATASVTIFVEPRLPVYVSSIHWQTTWGQTNGKMGVEATSECVNKTIKSFDYTVECTNVYGNTATSYLSYDGPTIKPGMTGKSKLTKGSVSGFSNAYSVKITPTKVYFTDGTSVTIPSDYRYTSNFTM